MLFGFYAAGHNFCKRTIAIVGRLTVQLIFAQTSYNMRRLFCLLVLSFVCLASFAQLKQTDLDKSPMDMSYWPNNYPILKFQGKTTEGPTARVTYSRPQKKGRVIFGGEIKYGDVWRLGANEATEIQVYKTLRINGKKLSKGRYTMACIPTETKWTIIVNKDTESWGTFSYDSKKDVFRVDVPITKTTEIAEAFTMYFEDNATGTSLIILWDDVKCVVPMVLN
jgi:Protein of unknown function (DUF2911)